MYGYIYFTENILTGMCYIGKRAKSTFQKTYLGSGTHLKLAFNKYGRENFVCQPIQWCKTKEELCNAEIYWINKCNAVESDFFYNIAPGGEGGYAPGELNGRYGKHTNCWTEEDKKHHSEVMKGDKNPMYGKQHSVETRRKISEARKGIPGGRPDHHGKNNPSYGRHWKLVNGHRQYLDIEGD